MYKTSGFRLNFKRKQFYNTGLMMMSCVCLVACGGSSGNTPVDNSKEESTTTRTYNGPGSSWRISLNKNDTTCTLEEKNSGLKANANCERLSSGFTKITVSSVTGTPSAEYTDIKAGFSTFAYELDGYMMPFVAPNNKIIPTVIAGSCPSGAIAHNFIVSYVRGSTSNDISWVSAGGYWDTQGDDLRIYMVDSDGNPRTGDGFSNGVLTQPNLSKNFNEQCKDGVLGDSEGQMYFTASGGLIMHQDRGANDTAETNFMVPKDDNLTQKNQLDGDYIGFNITGNGLSSVGYVTHAVSVNANNGVFTAKKINSETGEVQAQAHSVFTLGDLIAQRAGLFSATLSKYNETDAQTNTLLGCAAQLKAGDAQKKVVLCSGLLPDSGKNKAYSVLLVEK